MEEITNIIEKSDEEALNYLKNIKFNVNEKY